MSDILLSIVIPIGQDRIVSSDTLESIRQLDICSVEFIFVLDGYAEINEKLVQNTCLIITNAKCKVLRNDAAVGVGQARNFGCINAVGMYIGFLDSDDILHSEASSILSQINTSDNIDIFEVQAVIKDKMGEQSALCRRLPLNYLGNVMGLRWYMYKSFQWQSWLRIVKRELIAPFFFGNFRCYEDLYGF